MLLTRSRLCPRASPGSSLHLHVLSTPPAFVLSQDQTLREELLANDPEGPQTVTKSCHSHVRVPIHKGTRGYDGMFLRSAEARLGLDGSNLDAHLGSEDPLVRMLLSFQRPPRPVGEGGSFSESALGPRPEAGR